MLTRLLPRVVAVAVLALPTTSGAHAAAARCEISGALHTEALRACDVVGAFWGDDLAFRVERAPVDAAAETADGVVTVDPETWQAMSAGGRRLVLTHEVVHIATAGVTTARTPGWLVEGIAELVGARASGLPATQVAMELAAAVRAGRIPQHLPTATELGAGPTVAYAESWLAVDVLQRRLGDRGLRDFYRDVGERGLNRALVRVGLTQDELEQLWRRTLVARLG